MITIKHLKKSYDNVTPLKDVNAEIHKGDVVSIIESRPYSKTKTWTVISNNENA